MIPLDVDGDLVAVKEELLPCQSKWKGMAMILKLACGDLEAIETRYQGDPAKCQTEILTCRLRKKYSSY